MSDFRDKVKKLAAKDIWDSISKLEIDEDEESTFLENEEKPRSDDNWTKAEEPSEVPAYEEEFDTEDEDEEIAQACKEKGPEDLLEGGILDLHAGSEFEDDDTHCLGLSDPLELSIDSQERAQSSEDDNNEGVPMVLPRILLDTVGSQEDLDDRCYAMLHMAFKKLGWMLLPQTCHPIDEALHLVSTPIRVQRSQISSVSDNPPSLENSTSVNQGRSSEAAPQSNSAVRFEDIIRRMETGDIKFPKKNGKGYMTLDLGIPGLTPELIREVIAITSDEADLISKLLDILDMKEYIMTLCHYP
ncbi:phosphoprotein [Kern Canyon virus]|uniref:Phosphoprotein n=1 Tax=Kern Canyon virus TaxID=380433 RepID=A0A0D3R1K7_9RHAB|nr:phosphoprotein [Kern Canyon virus]AJR28350.1 phosphoprotein [Kern Canyon virus]